MKLTNSLAPSKCCFLRFQFTVTSTTILLRRSFSSILFPTAPVSFHSSINPSYGYINMQNHPSSLGLLNQILGFIKEANED
uniref:40S ribosomal protein S29-like n=1 Tax=Rhizophora mucronata TaxID=61149 RepID=A0A2P2KGC7_RHIMU